MAKKIYTCKGISAKEIPYYPSGCEIDADNMQDAIDILCKKIDEEVEDKHFRWMTFEPLAVWEIEHNLGKNPSVFMEDLEGNDIEGEIDYYDENLLYIRFSEPVSGLAYLN